MLDMEDTSTTIRVLEARIARSKRFRLLKNKRLRLTSNRHCVTSDFLSNQFPTSSSITSSVQHSSIQRTKLKFNENHQPLNTSSKSNLLPATISPQLDGLSNPNFQGIFLFNFSSIVISTFYNICILLIYIQFKFIYIHLLLQHLLSI
jgi:hypothetical protein